MFPSIRKRATCDPHALTSGTTDNSNDHRLSSQAGTCSLEETQEWVDTSTSLSAAACCRKVTDVSLCLKIISEPNYKRKLKINKDLNTVNVHTYIDEIISAGISTLYIDSILIGTPVYFNNLQVLFKMQIPHSFLIDIRPINKLFLAYITLIK